MSMVGVLPRLTEEGNYFVVLFSRFEFAARRAGWHRGTESAISWGKVAEAYSPAFLSHIRGQAHRLISAPPKDLTLINDEWRFPEGHLPEIKSTVDLFKAVAQVRNNLLHGEKPYWSQRDQELIADATKVLEAAYSWAFEHNLPLSKHVHESFGGGSP